MLKTLEKLVTLSLILPKYFLYLKDIWARHRLLKGVIKEKINSRLCLELNINWSDGQIITELFDGPKEGLSDIFASVLVPYVTHLLLRFLKIPFPI